MDAYHHQYDANVVGAAAKRECRTTIGTSLAQATARFIGAASKSCYKGLHIMKIRVFLATVALAALGWVRLPAATELMPIEDVKVGMEGIGRTVFEGPDLKEFKVKVLGVLKVTPIEFGTDPLVTFTVPPSATFVVHKVSLYTE